ncbi:MAG TPA: Uma2 family endonuclease [Vicinamibacteria bacterium]|nr:Uma2 family endonuclease [Vicinamibacteria bacterium]
MTVRNNVLDEEEPLTLDVKSVGLTEEQFYQLCADNPELRLELTANRELVIMSPTGGKTGRRNAKLTHRLVNWAERDGTGEVFESSTGFSLPNGAKRSPDTSWVKRARWLSLTEAQKDEFIPLCPDFVVELRSTKDRLTTLQAKMEEYIENGAGLGWLIDPKAQRVYVYRPGRPVECLERPSALSGDPVLSGFVFDLSEIW